MLDLIPDNPVLSESEIQVWSFALGVADTQPDEFRGTLSEDELERAQRFKFDRDRNHFIAARAALRLLLGRYLRTPPEQLVFGYGTHGKPMLAVNPDGIEFNLSHTHELAVYAFAKQRPVGIDIEYMQRKLDYERLAVRYFSPKEVEILKETPEISRKRLFLDYWTRKEALLKATGDGIRRKLSQVDVTEASTTNSIRGECDQTWSLQPLNVAPDYIGTLVGRGDGWTLCQCGPIALTLSPFDSALS